LKLGVAVVITQDNGLGIVTIGAVLSRTKLQVKTLLPLHAVSVALTS
jgi:hypothetical protein